jgi:DNA mismatch endonuclease (patch repair protein)
MMAGIRGKDTKPELALRRALHAAGLRYRVHGAKLAGKPDLVFAKYRAVVFVHGCFWHRHEDCRFMTVPATRPEFWQQKFASNVERDRRNKTQLEEAGWRVAVVWECALKERPINSIVEALQEWLLRDASPSIEVPASP